MTTDTLQTPDTATGTKLAADLAIVRHAVKEYLDARDGPITDKGGYAARWLFSKRQIDNLIAAGLPCCAVGKRRIRIVIDEADAWMRERYGIQRRGRRSKAKRSAPRTPQQEAA